MPSQPNKIKSGRSAKICVYQRYLRPIFIGIGGLLPVVPASFSNMIPPGKGTFRQGVG